MQEDSSDRETVFFRDRGKKCLMFYVSYPDRIRCAICFAAGFDQVVPFPVDFQHAFAKNLSCFRQDNAVS